MKPQGSGVETTAPKNLPFFEPEQTLGEEKSTQPTNSLGSKILGCFWV